MAYPQQKDWHRLGQSIERRIAELRLTQSEIQERGGPSPSKVREIVTGRASVLSPSKRRDLERALEWAPMSVDAVLAGGEPRPRAMPEGASSNYPEPELLTTVPVMQLLGYLRDVSAFLNAIDAQSLSPETQQQSALVRASTGTMLMSLAVGAEPRAAMQYMDAIGDVVLSVFVDQPQTSAAMQAAVQAIRNRKVHG